MWNASSCVGFEGLEAYAVCFLVVGEGGDEVAGGQDHGGEGYTVD